jgi:hypothetical protein
MLAPPGGWTTDDLQPAMNTAALRIITRGLNQSMENRGDSLRFIICASRWRGLRPGSVIREPRKRPVFVSLSVKLAPEFHPLAAVGRATTVRPDPDDHNTRTSGNQ